jgi:hypothetical protein
MERLLGYLAYMLGVLLLIYVSRQDRYSSQCTSGTMLGVHNLLRSCFSMSNLYAEGPFLETHQSVVVA